MMSEFERWDGRYAVPDYIFGKCPSIFLESCQAILPRSGKALAIADGEGRNGVWLALKGLDVLSLEFSPAAQGKARQLASELSVDLAFELADVHGWSYPPDEYDVVIDIFTQFSNPSERQIKWAGVRRTLKSGGLFILQGYTLKQLDYGTGGPKDPAQLFTRELVENAFSDFKDIKIVEQEVVLEEGSAHHGMSAFLGMTGYAP